MDVKKKRQLIGTAGSISATYDHIVPVKELTAPMESGAVVRVFCQGCGTVYGIVMGEALTYLSLVTKELEVEPETFAGYYFHTEACCFCDGNKFCIELKPIPKS